MKLDIRRLASSPSAFRDVLLLPGARGVVRFGPALADFQRRDFEAIDPALMAVRDGKEPPVNRYWIERVKGGSKDTDLSVCLLWLLAFSPRLLNMQVGAADQDQADELRLAAKGIVRVNPWLQSVIDVQDGRIVNVKTESACDIIAADVHGSHGARPDILVINEIAHIADGKQVFVENLMDNASKVPHGIMLVLTNAGFMDSWQHKLRETARTSPRWYFSIYDQPAPWISPAEVAERQRATSAARFNRLWRGIWASQSGDAIDVADIDAAVLLDGPQSDTDAEHSYVGGIDLGTKFDASALTVLSVNPHRRRIELAFTDSWKARPGCEVNLLAVLEAVRTVDAKFRPKWFVDPWQAALMLQLMRREGMRVDEMPFSAPNLDKMASAVINTFTSRTIALYRDEDLLADLKSFQLEDKGRTWRLIVPRNERGHADLGTSFAIALPEAVRLLRLGEFASPEPHFMPQGNPARFGHHVEATSAAGRFGLQLNSTRDGWERMAIPMPGNIPFFTGEQ